MKAERNSLFGDDYLLQIDLIAGLEAEVAASAP